MAITDRLVQASFKGASFYVRSESRPDGGRRIAVHDYVNSSDRYVEDLGQLPDEFEIEAFVHGQDWLYEAQQLEQALDEEGSGQLYMSALGQFTAWAMPYSKTIQHTALGEVTYRLKFTRGKRLPGPALTRLDSQTVYRRGYTARSSLASVLSRFMASPSTASNYTVSSFDITSGVSSLTGSVDSIIPATAYDPVSVSALSITRNIGSMVRSPALYAANLLIGDDLQPGLWQSVSEGLWPGENFIDMAGAFASMMRMTQWGGGLSLQLSDIQRSSFNGSSSVTSSAYTIPTWPATTYERIERNNNRLTTVRVNRLAALVGAYEVAAAREYETEDQIIATRATLEDAHKQLMRVEISEPDAIQADQSVRSSIESVRLAALQVMDDKEQTAYKIDEISVKRPRSSLLTAYDMYAERELTPESLSSRAISVRQLNNLQPAARLSGNVRVFTV